MPSEINGCYDVISDKIVIKSIINVDMDLLANCNLDNPPKLK